MEDDMCKIGDQVSVTSYSPFRGLRGTVRTVHTIAPDREDEEACCFYQIVLERAFIREPMWFTYDEVELIGPSKIS